MTPPNWDRVKHVFQEALERPAGEQLAFARERCGNDRAVLAEVESLLAAHKQAGRFAERPAVELLQALPIERDHDDGRDPVGVLHPGARLGAYQIQSLVGSGGMGEVYTARDTRLDRTVAIKVLRAHAGADARARERFEREARAVAALSHPHICTLHDVGHQDGIDFLVMEHLTGETLAQRLDRGPLPLEQAVEVAIQMASALDTAHRAGIVHRDLKPGNIFLVQGSRASSSIAAKLLDFGLAKTNDVAVSAPSQSPPSRLTSVGSILGTVQYMAPEQVEHGVADTRTDIFAFGTVLYEMVAARRAFEGDSEAAVIGAILQHDPPALSSLQPLAAPILDRIVSTCLAKDPDDRWQTARDLLHALTWLRDRSAASRNQPAGASTLTTAGTLGWIAAAVALALLAGFAISSSRPQATAAARRISFPVYPPPDTKFPRGTAEMAVSPDGSRLAFVVVSASGARRLWVRRFDSVSARPLEGTDNASYPFWSPDGRAIGFFMGEKVARIAEEGGAVQVLCTRTLSRGGTWGRDGTILFGSGGPIMRVGDSGGTPTPVTKLDASRKENSHIWPVFLPDGRRFLYLARSDDRQQTGIYQGAIDSPETHRVLANVSDVSPAGGYLFALSNRSLVAHAYDADRAQIIGESITIADGIALDNPERSGSAFATSPSGVLAYRSSSPDSHLIWFDRVGNEVSSFPGAADYHNPALSPDEGRIAVEKTDPATGRHTIWMIEAARGIESRLLFDPFGAHSVVWSPDGRRLVFPSNRLGGIDVYVAAADGAGEQLLLGSTEKASQVPTDWSRDGRYILYERNQRPTDLWVLPMSQTEKPRPFLATPSNERHGQFSPDVRWVAYMSDESGAPEIYVRRFPEGDLKWRVSTHGGAQPRWRRDGKELFYLAPDGKLMSAAVKAGAASFETHEPRPLFNTGIARAFIDRRNHYDVSSDGQRFLVNISDEDRNAAPITVVLNWNAALKK